MNTHFREFDEHVLDNWREKACTYSSFSALLKDLVFTFKIGRHDLSSLVGSLFDDVSGEDRQMIWHWDIESKGYGVSDVEIDESMNKYLK